MQPVWEPALVPAEPPFAEEPLRLPTWQAPSEPTPVGFVRGCCPCIIFDVSGTMAHRLQGRFVDVRAAVTELLRPGGEMASVLAFDVIAFASGPHSWSSNFEQRQRLVSDGRQLLTGRQVGDLPPAGAQPVLDEPVAPKPQPATEETLRDAQRWVDTWPEARGATCLLPALLLSRASWRHTDAIYLFSDGIVDDASAALAAVQAFKAAAERVPAVHCVGVHAEHLRRCPGHRGDKFLRALAAATGGTYQAYCGPSQLVWPMLCCCLHAHLRAIDTCAMVLGLMHFCDSAGPAKVGSKVQLREKVTVCVFGSSDRSLLHRSALVRADVCRVRVSAIRQPL
jgi:hypothetical protein